MAFWRPEEIAYCANVHPGTNAVSIENNLKTITSEVKKKSALARMHVGLWICENALEEYKNPLTLSRLKQTLREHNLSVLTLNGFPQGDFHQEIVKENIYQPNWSETRRLDYTLGLAQLLAECLSVEDSNGTISTLPLAYQRDWNENSSRLACQNLYRYVLEADKIFQKTGKTIRLCLEMEPGCVLEKTDQLIRFFTQDLRKYSESEDADHAIFDKYLGVCFDICHQAVMQENIGSCVERIHDAGLIIGKVQISSALVADFNCDKNTAIDLKPFAENKYLHQVTTRDVNGVLVHRDDLSTALKDEKFPRINDWRIHYHLPIQCDQILEEGNVVESLSTTQIDILHFLNNMDKFNYSPHLEIETYTWHVLPERQRASSNEVLVEGICRERNWLLSQLRNRCLTC